MAVGWLWVVATTWCFQHCLCVCLFLCVCKHSEQCLGCVLSCDSEETLWCGEELLSGSLSQAREPRAEWSGWRCDRAVWQGARSSLHGVLPRPCGLGDCAVSRQSSKARFLKELPTVAESSPDYGLLTVSELWIQLVRGLSLLASLTSLPTPCMFMLTCFLVYWHTNILSLCFVLVQLWCRSA